MFQTIIRTFLIYIFMFFAVKIMGKRELAQLHPFELIILLIISDMASVAMQGAGIPLLNSVIPIVTLTALQVGMSVIALNNPKMRRFLNGSPSILIKDGKINQKELKKLRMSIDDLAEELRTLGYFGISEVDYAVMETNGQVNAMPKSKAKNLTQEDININLPQDKPPHIFIADGVINETELSKAGKNKNWLFKELEKHDLKNEKNIFLAEFYQNELYIQLKKEDGGDK